MRYEKTLSNIQEVKAREGIVIAVCCNEDDRGGSKLADHVIAIPSTSRAAAAAARDRAAAVAGVSHRRAARLRCRPAAQSRQERHGGMKQHTGRLSVAPAAKACMISRAKSNRGCEDPGINRPADPLHPAHFRIPDDPGERRSRRDRRPERFLWTDRAGRQPAVPAYRRRTRRHAGAHPCGTDSHSAFRSR